MSPSLIFAGKMAATLLLVVDDEADAFWLMVSIVEDMMPQGFYGANIDALMREVRRFDAHLSAAQPALAKHLRALGIDAPTLGFVHGWFSSVFCGFLPLEARPSLIPSPCTQSTRAGIEWRRFHHGVCMARPYEEHHHSGRART